MTSVHLLKQRIRDSGYKKSYIAERMGITIQSLNNKLEGRTAFTLPEVQKICQLLHIEVAEREKIFFAHNVSDTEYMEGEYDS